MAEDLGQEDVVGLVSGFELVAADSSVGRADFDELTINETVALVVGLEQKPLTGSDGQCALFTHVKCGVPRSVTWPQGGNRAVSASHPQRVATGLDNGDRFALGKRTGALGDLEDASHLEEGCQLPSHE